MRRKIRSTKKLLLAIGVGFFVFIFLSAGTMIMFGDNFGKDESLLGYFYDEAVNVFIQLIGNNPPKILDLDDILYVCENEALDYDFTVFDNDGSLIKVSIDPRDPFFISPSGVCNKDEEDESLHICNIFSGNVKKEIINDNRVIGEDWVVYPEKIEVEDQNTEFDPLGDSKDIEIILIEVNNPPSIVDLGVQTVEIWTKGDDNVFDYTLSINDLETCNGLCVTNSPLLLSFYLEFLVGNIDGFDITDTGLMYYNFSGKEELIGIYNLSVCVNDSALVNPHEEIDKCLTGGEFSQSGDIQGDCEDFSLTVTNRNRPPNILSFSPINNETFDDLGTQVFEFNVTVYDADGTIPDISWLVDGVTKRKGNNSLYDEFSYTFGCGVSGDHNIEVVADDGLVNVSEIWNFNVGLVNCGPSAPDSGGGGGGGGGSSRKLYCEEKWGCLVWSQCWQLTDLVDRGWTKAEDRIIIEDRCEVVGYESEVCGFQSRVCDDLNFCNTIKDKPGIFKECYYTENPSCFDGIKNCHDGQCETLIDCGGSCNSCPTCSDNIKNQNELKADCGGVCDACVEIPFKIEKSTVLYMMIIVVLSLLILYFVVYRVYLGLKKKAKGIPLRVK